MARKSTSRGLLSVLAVYAVFLVLQFFPPNIPALKNLVGSDVYVPLLIALLSVLVCLISGGSLSRDLMLRPFRGYHLPAAFLLWISSAVGMTLLLRALQKAFPTLSVSGSTLTGELSRDSVWYAILLSALVPAVCEELLFRGFMLSTLCRSFSAVTASLLCGALFAVAHTSPAHMVPMLLSGFFLSLAGCFTGSVYIPMLIHFLNNLWIVLGAYLPSQTDSVRNFVYGNGIWVSLAIAVVTGAGGLLWMSRGRKR